MHHQILLTVVYNNIALTHYFLIYTFYIVKPQELSSGSHMYLFAIKLPQVNYPPSMHDNTFGHRIHYTLQGVIDLISVPQHNTASIPILYLPLVTGDECQKARKTQIFQKEDKKIEVIAEVIKPAYCPGNTSC